MKYRDYAPTGFDRKGLALRDQQDWRVAPCGRSRDSDDLEESNFHACLALLGGESEVVEVHRFGHWAVGWLEIIIVDPSDAQAIAALDDIESRLESYPVLDDDDWSQREYEHACETWEQASVKERLYYLDRCGGEVSIFAARRAELPEGLNDLFPLIG